jgi:hypothetical protein
MLLRHIDSWSGLSEVLLAHREGTKRTVCRDGSLRSDDSNNIDDVDQHGCREIEVIGS